MALKILKEDEPVLRQKARPVTRVNAATRKLLDDMLDTMRAASGAGLAAPQVGVSKRIIVVDAGEGPHELINPEILSAEGLELGIEGCLSIVGWVGEVERARSVRVTGYDREGRQVWLDGSGLLARALQHEIDHLDGVLFTDRAVSLMEADPPDEGKSKPENFRIVYMGTPLFAVEPLSQLIAAGHEILMVVTQPDRRGNRGRITEPEVKRFAVEHGLPVAQPESVRSPEFIEKVRSLDPDFIVVAAFGQRLPVELMDLAAYGAINIHASLLPRYRGAAPIQRALINGDTTSGITIMEMARGLDTGDILLQKEMPVEPADDAGSLGLRLSDLGAQMIVEALPRIASGELTPTSQERARVSHAPALRAVDEVIDWSKPADDIVNRIRALSPEPGARARFRGSLVKLWSARKSGEVPDGTEHGSVFVDDQGNMLVASGAGAVMVLELQPAGKKRVTWAEFSRGYKPAQGERFE